MFTVLGSRGRVITVRRKSSRISWDRKIRARVGWMITTNVGIDIWWWRVEPEGMAFTREAEEVGRFLVLVLDHDLCPLCLFTIPIHPRST